MANYRVTWNDTFDNNGTILCNVQIVSDGVQLGDYDMTLDDFVESISNAQIQEKALLIANRKKKIEANKLIVGIKKIETEPVIVSTPLLSTNTIFHMKSNSTEFVLTEIKPSQRDIIFYEHVFENVGFPRLIFGYFIYKNVVRDMYTFAIKGSGMIKKNTALYNFPYANVDRSGLICMGENTKYVIKNTSDCGTLHNLFFNAPSSSCHFTPNKNMLTEEENLISIYKKMQNKQFKSSALIANRYKNIDLFLKNIKGMCY